MNVTAAARSQGTHRARHRRLARARPADRRSARRDGREGRCSPRASRTSSTRRWRTCRHAASSALASPATCGKREAIAPRRRRGAERMRHVDILVNNAGATWGAPAEDHPLEAWDKVMNLNLRGIFVLAQHVGRSAHDPAQVGPHHQHRVDRRPGGQDPRDRAAPSPTTRPRAALVNFTRTLAAEWGKLRHHRQRDLPGLLPLEDDPGHARQRRRADAATGRRPSAWATTRT